jgi:hypothetical protein
MLRLLILRVSSGCVSRVQSPAGAVILLSPQCVYCPWDPPSIFLIGPEGELFYKRQSTERSGLTMLYMREVSVHVIARVNDLVNVYNFSPF